MKDPAHSVPINRDCLKSIVFPSGTTFLGHYTRFMSAGIVGCVLIAARKDPMSVPSRDPVLTASPASFASEESEPVSRGSNAIKMCSHHHG